MRLCLYEDRFAGQFEPLALTRPVFALHCGLSSLADKLRRHFAAQELGALIRPHLVDSAGLDYPFMAINDADWLRAAPTVLASARWLPPVNPANVNPAPHVGMVGAQMVYAQLPANLLTYCSSNTLDDCLETWRQKLPGVQVGGTVVDHCWDLLHHLNEEMQKDLVWRTLAVDRGLHPSQLMLVGPSAELYVHETAEIEPWVVADTTHGPVVVDREAKVEAFSRLEGPCYIGPRSLVLGAKLRHSMLGPLCRVGGEVEFSILQGCANKEHEGYLGHSYLGAWTHLAAGAEVASRRLDHQPIHVSHKGRRVATGCRRLGVCLGDHSQVGARGLLNAGSLIGAFCDLLPQEFMYPRAVPAFCRVRRGQIEPQDDLKGRFQTAAELMELRGWSLTPAQEALYRRIYDLTAAERRQLTAGWSDQRPRVAA
jgi:UDP-N-acetylglucosamine diphosphorylase/glucosamine-1-phosphate N-acetyltransferase